MHLLAAVIMAAPGQPAPTLAELAERPGLAATFVIKSGDGARLQRRQNFAEAILLKSAMLLLFEDAIEAAEFERAVRAAQAAAHREKGRRLGAAWRRRHRGA